MNEFPQPDLMASLDRIVPVTTSSPNWSDVERRSAPLTDDRAASTAHPARIRRTVVAAALVALVLATTAYAVVRYVIGSSAPPAVNVSEQLIDSVDAAAGLMGPLGRDAPVPEVSQTHAAAVLPTPAGPVYLWVAPTRAGSQCAYLEISGIGGTASSGFPWLMQLQPLACIPPQHRPLELNVINTHVDGRSLSIVAGYVPEATASTLELIHPTGTHSRPFPITDGFVLALGTPSDPRPTADIRNRAGHIIATDNNIYALPIYPIPTTPAEVTITIHLRYSPGTLTLRGGPAAPGGDTCQEIQVSRSRVSDEAGCGGRSLAGNPVAIDVNEGLIGDGRRYQVDFLSGQVGTNVARLTLRLSNGPEQRVPIQHGWVLYELNPTATPTQLIARNAHGTVVSMTSLR